MTTERMLQTFCGQLDSLHSVEAFGLRKAYKQAWRLPTSHNAAPMGPYGKDEV